MKIESLREVKNNFSEVIDGLESTGPVLVTKNGKGRALLLPIDENTDLETIILSNSPKFWRLMDQAASSKKTPMEELPDVDDEKGWQKLAGK
jgi:prevent-host-death family protein